MAAGTQTAYDIDVADVEYLRHGDKPLLARLFKPRGSGPFPIMVELHGGAWVRGDRLNGNAPNEALAKHGVIVAALDFRVPPEAPYPASLADIHYGIRWCKTQAAAWNGRPDWIGAMGTSSGAHQAMLLGMLPHESRYAARSLLADGPAGARADEHVPTPAPRVSQGPCRPRAQGPPHGLEGVRIDRLGMGLACEGIEPGIARVP